MKRKMSRNFTFHPLHIHIVGVQIPIYRHVQYIQNCARVVWYHPVLTFSYSGLSREGGWLVGWFWSRLLNPCFWWFGEAGTSKTRSRDPNQWRTELGRGGVRLGVNTLFESPFRGCGIRCKNTRCVYDLYEISSITNNFDFTLPSEGKPLRVLAYHRIL